MLVAGLIAAGISLYAADAHYVGSSKCAFCHGAIYDRWQKTRMANVVRDPREHPEAILPYLNFAPDFVKFSRIDIALVYGSKWKQRYFARGENDYYPLGAQWDVEHRTWLPYAVKSGTDWWTEHYPADNRQRPTGPLCDGCHSVNYDVKTKTVTEWNVGCERCHGPGSAHGLEPTKESIVNPARLDPVRASDTCIQCHSQGQPTKNPIEGQYYDWPVGYDVRGRLSDHWRLEEQRLGETNFYYFADGTAHKNRMQGNDFTQSQMYTHGVTCFTCHDPHGSAYPADLRRPAQALCLGCHGPGSPNGPHVANLTEHTHHAATSAGSECIACHMPKIEQTLADDFVRGHTFRFITPAMTGKYKIPNPCSECHQEKSVAWAGERLAQWSERSPWRMQR